MKITKMILTWSAVLLVAFSLSAQPKHGGEGKGEGGKHHKIWAMLDLNETQKAEIKKLHEEMKPKRMEHRKTMKAVREKVKAEMQKESSDRAVITTYSREMAELHFKQAEAMADHLLKVKQILTPEQFKKMTDLHEMKKEWKKHGKGGGHGKGHGGCGQH